MNKKTVPIHRAIRKRNPKKQENNKLLQFKAPVSSRTVAEELYKRLASLSANFRP